MTYSPQSNIQLTTSRRGASEPTQDFNGYLMSLLTLISTWIFALTFFNFRWHTGFFQKVSSREHLDSSSIHFALIFEHIGTFYNFILFPCPITILLTSAIEGKRISSESSLRWKVKIHCFEKNYEHFLSNCSCF